MRQETIENYLKNIYHLSSGNSSLVGNFQLAARLGIRPASVTEGLRKLHELKYVTYEKSYGTRLTTTGIKLALNIVRRHRIWETYLARELGFGWDEVHEIAEELEHISNDRLINKLEERLGNPVYDPHGDPIPDRKGRLKKTNFISLSEAAGRSSYTIMGVSDHSVAFLKHLEKHQLVIGTRIQVLNIEPFDQSMIIKCNQKEIVISPRVAAGIIVEESR